MNKIKNIFTIIFAGMLILLFLTACSEELSTQSDVPAANNNLIESKRFLSLEQNLVVTNDSNYPQSCSGTSYALKNKRGYLGFKMTLPNGSTFWVDNHSLTPPPETKPSSNVTITMTAEMDQTNNTLFYTFDPSGCTFDPPAEVYLSWSDLNASTVKLFLIDENGNQLETYPDGVDEIGQYLILRIPHFSRYAVAYSD